MKDAPFGASFGPSGTEGPLRQLALDIFQRGKRIATRGSVRIGAGQSVEDVPIQPVQFVRAACCQFKLRDKSHVVLQVLEAPTTGAFGGPAHNHSSQGEGCVGRPNRTEGTTGERSAIAKLTTGRMAGGAAARSESSKERPNPCDSGHRRAMLLWQARRYN